MSERTRDAAWRHAVLSYDFDGSAKDNYIQARFRDVIVTARKPNTCSTCFGSITPGTLNRVEVVKMDDEVLHARHCQDCCDAMAVWPESDALERRMGLGEKRARQNRKKAVNE